MNKKNNKILHLVNKIIGWRREVECPEMITYSSIGWLKNSLAFPDTPFKDLYKATKIANSVFKQTNSNLRILAKPHKIIPTTKENPNEPITSTPPSRSSLPPRT